MFKNRVAVLILAILAVVLLSGCGTSSAEPRALSPVETVTVQEVNLNGTWESTNPDVQMAATVADGTIIVNWISDDVSALYWKGTAPTHAVDGQVFMSEADVEALSRSILGSSDTTKAFTYEDEKLSYGFTVMGVTQTIYLERK